MNADPFSLPKIGTFEPKFFDSGELLCFACSISFRGCEPRLIIYPVDNAPPSPDLARQLSERFDQFCAGVDKALKKLPKMLRRECANYELQINHLSDDEIVDGLEWENIKLDPSGCIACYVKNLAVTNNFDIAIEFSKKCKLVNLHFDG
jgi:hypothetical protein